jgi:hypothetical protein
MTFPKKASLVGLAIKCEGQIERRFWGKTTKRKAKFVYCFLLKIWNCSLAESQVETEKSRGVIFSNGLTLKLYFYQLNYELWEINCEGAK